jgi:hypothetical protein
MMWGFERSLKKLEMKMYFKHVWKYTRDICVPKKVDFLFVVSRICILYIYIDDLFLWNFVSYLNCTIL